MITPSNKKTRNEDLVGEDVKGAAAAAPSLMPPTETASDTFHRHNRGGGRGRSRLLSKRGTLIQTGVRQFDQKLRDITS